MELCNLSNIKRILSKYETGTKKFFGQNFLINREVPTQIAKESASYHTQAVGTPSCALEIGPGIGCLSNELCLQYQKVVAVEIDQTLIPILNETMAEHKNFSVVNEDFLKLDLKSFLKERFGNERVSVCANLPYYITTPILMKLLEENTGKLVSLTVMVQKEVADRLCATEKDGDYGAITASIHYYGKVTRLFDVTPENFFPSPKVTSSVIRVELYENKPYAVNNEKMLFEIIAGAFAQRRKTLVNSLCASVGYCKKEKVLEILGKMGLPETIRGERLSIADFCRFTNEMENVK